MFYQARYYDPRIGRFTQPDTIIPDPADPQAYDRYQYVRNNPANHTDPTGHAGLATQKVVGSGDGSIREEDEWRERFDEALATKADEVEKAEGRARSLTRQERIDVISGLANRWVRRDVEHKVLGADYVPWPTSITSERRAEQEASAERAREREIGEAVAWRAYWEEVNRAEVQGGLGLRRRLDPEDRRAIGFVDTFAGVGLVSRWAARMRDCNVLDANPAYVRGMRYQGPIWPRPK